MILLRLPQVVKPIVPTGTTTDPDYWNWHGGGDSTSTTAVSSQPQKDFSYVVQSDHIVITEFSKTVTEIVIPSQIDYLPVTEIGNGAFQNATKLKKLHYLIPLFPLVILHFTMQPL